jgi:NAD(P)H-hydrate epimerase
MSKFDAGTLLIVGGARGLTGAPCMTAMSAVRTGAGYVQLVVPRSLEAVFETRLLEPMTRGATDSDGSHLPETVSLVSEMAERAHALVLGPGLGRAEGALELARLVARDVQRPLVIDADGLNAHIGHLETLAMRRQATVLTPHAGELGRLLAQDASDVQKHRLSAAREAARRSGATVVLKGDDSLVASPSGSVAVSPGGSPALATAGTGDVLSGMIGTLLAKGLDAPRAASAAVLAHAQAGQLAARAQGASHTSAADVIDAIAPSFSDGAKSK